MAQYEYIAFLDADDYWDANYLKEAVELIHLFPNAIMYGIGWNFADISTTKQPFISNDNRAERIMIDNYWTQNRFCYTSSSITISKKALVAVGGFDERISYGEDSDMWYRLILIYPLAQAYSTRVLAYYIQDAENRIYLSTHAFNRNWVCYVNKYEKYLRDEKFVDFKRYVMPLIARELFSYMDSASYRHNKMLRLRIRCVRAKLDLKLLRPLTILRLYIPSLFRMKRKIVTIISKCHK